MTCAAEVQNIHTNFYNFKSYLSRFSDDVFCEQLFLIWADDIMICYVYLKYTIYIAYNTNLYRLTNSQCHKNRSTHMYFTIRGCRTTPRLCCLRQIVCIKKNPFYSAVMLSIRANWPFIKLSGWEYNRQGPA